MTAAFHPKLWLYRLADWLLVAGIGLLVMIFFPVATREVDYQINKKSLSQLEVVSSPEAVNQAEQQNSFRFQSKIIVPVSFDFSLVIPDIGVNAPVFPNIDSANPDEYRPVLKNGVAHAKNSSLPDQPGPVFIFAHSTDTFYNIGRYNAVFFLLRKLNTNDEVFVFYNHKKYTYQVKETKIVEPDAVSQEVKNLNANYLVLQTCHPPGTTLRRLLVIAEPAQQ